MKYKKRKKVRRTAMKLLGDRVTPDSLRAEVATPNLSTHNDSHEMSTKIKTHREGCQTLLHV